MIRRIIRFLALLLEQHGDRVLLWNGVSSDKYERIQQSFECNKKAQAAYWTVANKGNEAKKK